LDERPTRLLQQEYWHPVQIDNQQDETCYEHQQALSTWNKKKKETEEIYMVPMCFRYRS